MPKNRSANPTRSGSSGNPHYPTSLHALMADISPAQFATLDEWNRRVTRAAWGHHKEASRLGARHYYFGVPTIALSTFVATTVFRSVDCWTPWFTALTAIAAVLASCQTFFGFQSRADAHRKSATAYSGIRRKIEMLTGSPPTAEGEINRRMEILQLQMDLLADHSPSISKKVWTEAEAHYHKDRYRSTVTRLAQPERGSSGLE